MSLKISPIAVGAFVVVAGGIALIVAGSKKKAISPAQLDAVKKAADDAAAKAVADAQAVKVAAAAKATAQVVAQKAAAVTTNVAPASLPTAPIAGQLVLGVTPKSGVSTDDITTAIDQLTHDKLGGAISVTPKATTYTDASGRTLVQKSWDVSVLPAQVTTIVAYVHHVLDPLGLAKPSVAFASPTLNAAA